MLGKLKRAFRVARTWVVGVFDLKDVWDLVLQGINIVTSGTVVNWLAGFWEASPPALNATYMVGAFMIVFGVVSLAKGKVRGTAPSLRQTATPKLAAGGEPGPEGEGDGDEQYIDFDGFEGKTVRDLYDAFKVERGLRQSLESEHEGCFEHRQVLEGRVTELEAENEGLSLVVHQPPNQGLIYTEKQVSHSGSGRSEDLTWLMLTWHLTNAGQYPVYSSRDISGRVKMNDVPLVTPPSLSQGFQSGLAYMQPGVFEIKQYLTEAEKERFLALQRDHKTTTFEFNALQTHIRSDDPDHTETDVLLSLPFLRP